MEIFYQKSKDGLVSDFKSDKPLVAVLGNFDGVHVGHAALISAAVSEAEKIGGKTAVWTFSGKPAVKRGDSLFYSDMQKSEAFDVLGADYTVFCDFDCIKGLTPAEFVNDVLCGGLDCKIAVCGENFTFGAAKSGNAQMLSRLMREQGREAVILPLVKQNGVTVSSTLIRGLIESGDCEQAAKLLGRPFFMTLDVKEGFKIGRSLGFPTINQQIPAGGTVPSYGVYCTKSIIDGAVYQSITNVGTRPTVHPNSTETVCETHIFGYSGELYGHDVTVEFYKKLRDEVKFSSFEELKKSVERDIRSTQEFFANINLFGIE